MPGMNQHSTPPPLVDVAIVTYNHERFISQAIESVLAQKTDFAYRIVIGDDCSDDNTQQIIKNYAEKYPELISTVLYSKHVGVLHKERVGLKILESCTARYLALLDGDDYWTKPAKLQKQVDYLEQHPDLAICFHNVLFFHEDGSRDPWNFCQPNQKEISTIEDLLAANIMQTCSVMLRRDLIGELPEWYHTSATGDWLLYLLTARHGNIGYLDEVMAAYRINPESFWNSKPSTYKLIDGVKTLEKLNEYLEYKYDGQIKATVLKYLDVLTNLYENQGDRANARNFLIKRLKLGLVDYRLPDRLQLKRLLRLQNPRLYKLFRAMRNVRASPRS